MSENTYEYECMRAELLGIEKPDYDDFLKRQQEREISQNEEAEIENLKELESQNDALSNVTGGLDELNTILKATQQKLNNFKATACGSLTNIFKGKIDVKNNAQETATSDNNEHQILTDVNETKVDKNVEKIEKSPYKSDLSKALDNHVDRLDSLIEKSERAELSMSHQNKQMKGYLNK